MTGAARSVRARGRAAAEELPIESVLLAFRAGGGGNDVEDFGECRVTLVGLAVVEEEGDGGSRTYVARAARASTSAVVLRTASVKWLAKAMALSKSETGNT